MLLRRPQHLKPGTSPSKPNRRFDKFFGFQPFSTFAGLLIQPPLRRGLSARRRKARLAPRRQPLARIEALEFRLNLTPVANPDTYYGNLSAATTIPAAQGVLANDTGSNLTAILVSNPYFGSVTLNSDGSFTYTNTNPQYGGDSFSYKDFDGTNYSNTASVTLHLSTDGAAPSAYNIGPINAVHDRQFSLAAPGLVDDGSDPNGLPLTAVLDTGPSHGTAAIASDGALTYTPDYHYVGSDSLTYELYNGYQYSAPATVSFNVYDNPPSVIGHGYPLPNGQTLTVDAADGVLNGDSDPDGDTLTALLYSQPSHGNLTLNSDGSFSYTPDSGWVGTDTFQYEASDGIDDSCRLFRNDYALLA